jgi:hypothetical protein
VSGPAVPPPPERPKPLTELAIWVGPVCGLLAGFVGFLVPLGFLSQDQADQINSLWPAVAAGLIPVISTTAGVLLQARLSRSRVTPVSDPRDNDGTRLVRIDSARLAASIRTARATSPRRYVPPPSDPPTDVIDTDPDGVPETARHERPEGRS